MKSSPSLLAALVAAGLCGGGEGEGPTPLGKVGPSYGENDWPGAVAFGKPAGEPRFEGIADGILSHDESVELIVKTAGNRDGLAYSSIVDNESEEVALYKLAGALKRVTKKGEALPFAAGQVVKDNRGRNHRIVSINRKSAPGTPKTHDFPIVTLVTLPNGDESVHTYRADGTDFSSTSLVNNVGPDVTDVVFVPFVPTAVKPAPIPQAVAPASIAGLAQTNAKSAA